MNIFALRSNSLASSAYKNLSRSQYSLNDNISRLASGLRINKAADDSAGSAISTRMSNQIQGMKQANDNSQQANNLIQTAENGLNDISGMLSRMRELAVQAATDTLNNTDRASIDLEYQALKNEITRIANVTEYNEMDILNGTYYRNQMNAANSTVDDVMGVSITNLSNDIRKGVYTLSDEVISVSGQANISNLPGANIGYDTSVQPGSYSLSTIETQISADYALQFEGSNDYILIDDDKVFHIESEITQAAWVKLDKLPSDHAIIFGTRADGSGRNIGFGYGMNSGNGIKVWTNGKTGGFKDINDNKTELKVGQWYYMAYTHTTDNDGLVRIFVDGTVTHEEESKNPVLPAVNTSAVQVGTWAGEAWPGAVDEVQLWNRALSEAEIKANMDNKLAGSESGLVGHWNFNEGSGNTVTDLSGNNNHGILINNPTRIVRSPASTTRTLTVTGPSPGQANEIAYNLTDTTIDFSDQGLGLEVNTSDASAMTSALLSSSETFTIPETRKLTITSENGVQ